VPAATDPFRSSSQPFSSSTVSSLQIPIYALYSAFLSSVAEGIFFFYSHRADNRFIKGIVGTYEVDSALSKRK
jgi:hypothetical protein